MKSSLVQKVVLKSAKILHAATIAGPVLVLAAAQRDSKRSLVSTLHTAVTRKEERS